MFTSIEGWVPTANARGVTDPGTLEAAWHFDNSESRAIVDTSGNHLGGSFKNGATVVTGNIGDVLTLEGANQFVDLGDPVSLRLVGSMTLSAWMKASSFSDQDGAIVSRRERFGYQLDTTIYRGPSVGPRTIGFRLTNASGRLMARFGRTPLDEQHMAPPGRCLRRHGADVECLPRRAPRQRLPDRRHHLETAPVAVARARRTKWSPRWLLVQGRS